MKNRNEGEEPNPMKDKVARIYEETEAYKEVPTTMEGVHLCVLPQKNNRKKSLAVHVRLPRARRGVYLRSMESLEKLRDILKEEKLEDLLRVIESMSPEPEKPAKELLEL